MLKLIISDANGYVIDRKTIQVGTIGAALSEGAAHVRLIYTEDAQCASCQALTECATDPFGNPICEPCFDKWVAWAAVSSKPDPAEVRQVITAPKFTEKEKAALRAGIEKAFAETDGIPGIVNSGAIHIPITVPKIECPECGRTRTNHEIDIETCFVCHPPAPYAPEPKKGGIE